MQFSYLPKIRTTYFLSVQEPHLRFFSRIGCPVSKDFYRLVKPKKYKRNYMRDTLFDSPLFVGLLTTVTYQPLLSWGHNLVVRNKRFEMEIWLSCCR